MPQLRKGTRDMTQTERDRAEKAAKAHVAAKAYAESCDPENHDQFIEKYGDFIAGYEQAMKDAEDKSKEAISG